MKRTLVLAAVLTASLSACSGGSAGLAKDSSLQSQPTSTPAVEATTDAPAPADTSAAGCPVATDDKDLTKKPTYTVPKAAAPTTTTSTDIVVGTGPAAKDGDHVVAKYLGVNYATGEEFDSSWKSGCDNTFDFTIGSGVIPGFSKGVTGMKAGGRRLVVIPPADGYGDQGPVPGGTLAFVIDLVKIG